MPNASPHRIEILAFANAQLLDITGPAQVFATANDLTPSGAPKPYAITIVSADSDVATSSGIVLRSEALPQAASDPGTLIVSGGYGVNAACRDPALLDWIRRRAVSATRTASVCSGAFLLAEAGLLDGRRAVTHWGRCAEFAARFPAVKLDPDPIFVRDGPIWTSAGVTAGIDLALAMVEADQGRPLALAIARQLVVFLKRPGGQAQFSAALALQEADETFERLHGWIANHLDRDLSLGVLADQMGMSLRSFSRHYKKCTGRTPAESVETIRVESARRFFEEGASVIRTATRCGFGSTETMRRAFLRHLGVGPNAYRNRFHG
ncbi:GlxA family transcriptional regulator [Rhizobium sp. VS19-DR104.2]|uniref:GlxA family transcriptional regulator n=1 Tax=unclassified Rhizobium TaxID=2613769 RepID=UPI001C5BDC4C|nr:MULTISPECIES: GlxA family transcriptional regulator [unclassified Rhizobium]MBZ5762469.1 GlxA family transcriptional regulator [Rhizobium sp. VS19-DR96]MBZ5768516.1 GlxA family transcriptional regulator [Rhizobium sp. VS19-DR129.2]MBZ5776034.1 GlxA family transcriptional regulator [Rhizobium sp. VS19-DRK62.2]MBZ5787194.1 GlxA family transcriptional regulator [Rhizobium sp. VS19-DR121]MBZ5804547.1 GlxA family transcriptional regulator [Rhizobium sp. VS19-DR181]